VFSNLLLQRCRLLHKAIHGHTVISKGDQCLVVISIHKVAYKKRARSVGQWDSESAGIGGDEPPLSSSTTNHSRRGDEKSSGMTASKFKAKIDNHFVICLFNNGKIRKATVRAVRLDDSRLSSVRAINPLSSSFPEGGLTGTKTTARGIILCWRRGGIY
jgi:hypothetical protein